MTRSQLWPAGGTWDSTRLSDWSKAGWSGSANAAGAVRFGPGEHIITDRIFVSSALTGAGSGRTTLVIPKPLYDKYGQGAKGGGKHGYSYAHGWIESKDTSNLLVEGLTIRFPSRGYVEHFDEKGYNAFEFYRVAGARMRDVVIENAETNILIRKSSHNIHIEPDVIFKAPGVSASVVGHYGLQCHDSWDCLIECQLEASWRHDLSVVSGAHHNVFRGCKGPNLNFDHHGRNPHHNLWVKCNVGRGDRVFKSGGSLAAMPHSGPGETFWDCREGDGSPLTALPDYFGLDASWGTWHPKIVVVVHEANSAGDDTWIEGIASVEPSDLYAAQKGEPTPAPPPRGGMPPMPSISVRLKLEGNPATEAYSVQAIVDGGAVTRVQFKVDGFEYHNEYYPPFSLFGDAGGVLKKSRLGDGHHTIEANAYQGEVLVASAQAEGDEGAPVSLTLEQRVEKLEQKVAALEQQ